MPRMIQNVGSTARDFCMLERNILAHLKLALLLSLLSSSVLLRARLPDPDSTMLSSKAGIPMAALLVVASLTAIGGAYFEYTSNMRAMRNMRAFLVATNPHLALTGVVAGVVFTTCVILITAENEL